MKRSPSKKKIIGILQPAYLPWMGYFEQMAYVDHFVFMDDVQYTRHDWRNRNRIKTPTGSIWITVPVTARQYNTLIRDVIVDYSTDWVRKHLRSIGVNYQKCQYFQPLFDDLKHVLLSRPERLVDLDARLIQLLCRYLKINTQITCSSEIPKRHWAYTNGEPSNEADRIYRKNIRVLEICRHCGAELLYDGKKAAEFIDVSLFREKGIEVVFQDYQHPVYDQRHGEFLSHQSAIDLIMNTGPDAAKMLRSSPVPAFAEKHSNQSAPSS